MLSIIGNSHKKINNFDIIMESIDEMSIPVNANYSGQPQNQIHMQYREPGKEINKQEFNFIFNVSRKRKHSYVNKQH